MPVNLKGRSFLTLKDFSREEILFLLDLSAKLKADKYTGQYCPIGQPRSRDIRGVHSLDDRILGIETSKERRTDERQRTDQ